MQEITHFSQLFAVCLLIKIILFSGDNEILHFLLSKELNGGGGGGIQEAPWKTVLHDFDCAWWQ